MSRSVSRTRSARGISRFLTVFIAVLAVVVGTVAPATEAPASASVSASTSLARATGDSSQSGIAKASLTGFNPGNIISDAVFTNKNTMSEAQIQSFFNSKVSKCVVGNDENGKPFVCLKDYRISSVNRPADSYCSGYNGAANESAARIIYRVAQACNINPQVLIVMLQKEQGLVTHVWPSAWRYDSALGQGCPDTAPCDPNFVGFFHQIYGAARQMQIYMEGRWFQWYAPGNTWGILWHPNANCGRGNVYVANKATSALYYYTPYQPNAAAMRAGYGEGDGCSSYGNRNFYNYFTDWFGSTQNPTSLQGLVNVGNRIWLLSGSNRYHVTAEAYTQYRSVFAAATVISEQALSAYREGPRADFVVRNDSTGVIAYLATGGTHRFPDCGLVTQWGGSCTSLVSLTDAHFRRWTAGAEMTAYGRLSAGGTVHQMEGSTLYPLYNDATAKLLNGDTAPYSPVMSSAAKAKKSVADRVRFAPGTFIQVQGKNEVWLPDRNGTMYHLQTWPHATELGMRNTVFAKVPPTAVKGYSMTGKLASFVRCGGTDYVAAGGKLSHLSGPVPDGFPIATLDAQNCAALKLTGPKINGSAVFVKFTDRSTVYHLTAGKYRAVATVPQLVALNGGKSASVLTSATALRERISLGDAYPPTGTLIRVNGTSEVWAVDGLALLHLPYWEMANEYGLPTRGRETVVPATTLANMNKTATALTVVAQCGGAPYVASSGKLVGVPAASLDGNQVTTLSDDFCRGRVSGSVSGPVMLTDGTRTSVAVGGGFLGLPDAESVARAAAGSSVSPLRVGAGYLNRLPVAVTPTDGALVRASNENTVTLISGGVRHWLPNWGVSVDLGIRDRYQAVVPAAIAPVPQSEPDLSIFVICRGANYIASGGRLFPLSAEALGGFSPTPLSDATCDTLNLTGDTIRGAVQLVSSTGGTRYELRGGRLVATNAVPPANAVVLKVDPITIAGLPIA